MTLAAKQLDLDALLRGKGEDSASPARVYAGLAELAKQAADAGGPPVAVDLEFSAATAIVGAQTLSDIAFKVSGAAGTPLAGDLTLKLPGDSALRLSGRL